MNHEPTLSTQALVVLGWTINAIHHINHCPMNEESLFFLTLPCNQWTAFHSSLYNALKSTHTLSNPV